MPSMPSMPSFSVGDIKGKLQDTKDRYSSVPLKKTNWDPHSGKPPPPPPPQSKWTKPDVTLKSSFAPPPTRSRPQVSQSTRPNSDVEPSPPSSRPVIPSRLTRSSTVAAAEHVSVDKIDWANLSPEDKQAFFSWLDEFFARYLNLSVPPRSVHETTKVVERPKTSEPPPPATATLPAPVPSTRPGGPPRVATWSKPKLPTSSASYSDELSMSYPPSTTRGCEALDFAQYFLPSTYWDEAWYSSEPYTPPPLRNAQLTFRASSAPTPHIMVWKYGVLFSDLSYCWFSVEYPHSASNVDPNDTQTVKRTVRYLPRPRPLDGPALVDAHETYGETIAAFAESFAGTGQYCARGECWGLANEALKYFDEFDYVPRPVPSLHRTHGHLIFEGRATGNGTAGLAGRWRGGDDRVRRGDIVEWRKAKIRVTTQRAWREFILGAPDHTAVIVQDAQPRTTVSDGASLSPADLGMLVVVDQSVGSPPEQKELDLTGLVEGEIWIYRPVSMVGYLNLESTEALAECPPGTLDVI